MAAGQGVEELSSLVVRARAGELDAYGEIVRRFQGTLVAFAKWATAASSLCMSHCRAFAICMISCGFIAPIVPPGLVDAMPGSRVPRVDTSGALRYPLRHLAASYAADR